MNLVASLAFSFVSPLLPITTDSRKKWIDKSRRHHEEAQESDFYRPSISCES
ncbi:predicted protein [Plenodomus lingam JN3]|uniref:Uncharacterized protein n=1 Tax=Leptosphaeria maculans (strain JN3 / isolate v23.1.3 / race Av1-4-5-6-7-8) TaxID=985895 RepID=E4ZH19_LEPMJ|nr:predicted protein [Plenodomus lingam JN3]CBX90589.1 predicted protein [Plenodomus lingam JN3]